MAENVKRRVAAARLAVAFVAAGTIGGATWAQASAPPPTAESSAVDVFLKANTVKSENIVNGSLFFKDFHKGEVTSADVFVKYKKATNSTIGNIKGELGDIKLQIGDIKGESKDFLKLADTDSRYLKLDASVLAGDGSVFTASKALEKGTDGVTLVDVPNLVKVEATDLAMKVTNTSGAPLIHSACVNGQPAGDGELQPGASLSCPTGQNAQTLQLIGTGPGGGPHVLTLNFSNLPTPDGSQATVQILIGL